MDLLAELFVRVFPLVLGHYFLQVGFVELILIVGFQVFVFDFPDFIDALVHVFEVEKVGLPALDRLVGVVLDFGG